MTDEKALEDSLISEIESLEFKKKQVEKQIRDLEEEIGEDDINTYHLLQKHKRFYENQISDLKKALHTRDMKSESVNGKRIAIFSSLTAILTYGFSSFVIDLNEFTSLTTMILAFFYMASILVLIESQRKVGKYE